MLLKEKLQAAESPDALLEIINPIIAEGVESEFGEFLRLSLEELETTIVAAIKSRQLEPDVLQNLAGRLQCIEEIRLTALTERVLPEENDDAAGN